MKKLIITNGCSFTVGAELDNIPTQAYPYLIGNKLNREVINLAYNGKSNEAILRTTIDYLAGLDLNKCDPILIIGWSGISRKEIFVNGSWLKITPTQMGHDPYAKAHFKYLQSEKQDNLEFFNHVLLMQLLLEKLKINYFFFRIDNGQTPQMLKDGSKREVTDGYDLSHIPSHDHIKLINLDRFPGYNDDSLTFREYALSNGGGLKPQRHPDEISHSLFADYIMTQLNSK